jgi:hypothetical protein
MRGARCHGESLQSTPWSSASWFVESAEGTGCGLGVATRFAPSSTNIKISAIKPQERRNGGNFRQATPDAADTIWKAQRCPKSAGAPAGEIDMVKVLIPSSRP